MTEGSEPNDSHQSSSGGPPDAAAPSPMKDVASASPESAELLNTSGVSNDEPRNTVGQQGTTSTSRVEPATPVQESWDSSDLDPRPPQLLASLDLSEEPIGGRRPKSRRKAHRSLRQGTRWLLFADILSIIVMFMIAIPFMPSIFLYLKSNQFGSVMSKIVDSAWSEERVADVVNGQQEEIPASISRGFFKDRVFHLPGVPLDPYVLTDAEVERLITGATTVAPPGFTVRRGTLDAYREHLTQSRKTQEFGLFGSNYETVEYDQYVINGRWIVVTPRTQPSGMSSVTIGFPGVSLIQKQHELAPGAAAVTLSIRSFPTPLARVVGTILPLALSGIFWLMATLLLSAASIGLTYLTWKHNGFSKGFFSKGFIASIFFSFVFCVAAFACSTYSLVSLGTLLKYMYNFSIIAGFIVSLLMSACTEFLIIMALHRFAWTPRLGRFQHIALSLVVVLLLFPMLLATLPNGTPGKFVTFSCSLYALPSIVPGFMYAWFLASRWGPDGGAEKGTGRKRGRREF